MGTLTADSSRLPEYCDHKLPTSCRLTSIPKCCACADERPHSLTYPTYVDGVGFVPRGSRQLRYCWYCKEFWNNRIAQTNLLPSQTRIPAVPDQSAFLAQWYDFHRGYRVVARPDGSEERIAVLGEPLREVSPGLLPRTLAELRAGRQTSAADPVQHVSVVQPDVDAGPSIEDALAQMMEVAESEESQPPPVARVAGQAMRPAPSRNHEHQARRIAALRRELHRMRHGIERVIAGLRDLGESVPDSVEATGRLVDLGRTLDIISASQPPPEQEPVPSGREGRAPVVGSVYRDPALTSTQQRLDEAQRQLDQARRYRDQSSSELHLAQTNHSEAAEVLESAELDLSEHREQISQLRREQRTAENYTRIFGTREDMERQGADYESPINGMFTRAWERYRTAEEVRREQRTLSQVIQDEQLSQASGRLIGEDQDGSVVANTVHEDQLNEYYTMLRRQNWTQPDLPAPGQGSDQANATSEVGQGQNVAQTETASLELPAEAESTTPSSDPPRTSQLAWLLRNTSEPERSAIIARMVENGTAQALEESPAGNVMDVWRRLRDAYAPFRGPYIVYSSESEDDDDDDDDETRGGRGLDAEDSGRPEPTEDGDMTVRLDCKICYTQVADTACLPCGHLVMCQWCSEQHSPVMQHDRTRPSRPANCPVCRKRIKQKVRIYRA